MLKKARDDEQMQTYSDKYVENLREGSFQDVRIWEQKRYVEQPILCEADGPIMKLRRWVKQVYEPIAQADTAQLRKRLVRARRVHDGSTRRPPRLH